MPNFNEIDASIVEIARVSNQMEAELLQQVLAEEGIVSMVKPSGAGHGFASPALVEHALLVRSDQAPLAREVVDAFSAEEDDDTFATADPTLDDVDPA